MQALSPVTVSEMGCVMPYQHQMDDVLEHLRACSVACNVVEVDRKPDIEQQSAETVMLLTLPSVASTDLQCRKKSFANTHLCRVWDITSTRRAQVLKQLWKLEALVQSQQPCLAPTVLPVSSFIAAPESSSVAEDDLDLCIITAMRMDKV